MKAPARAAAKSAMASVDRMAEQNNKFFSEADFDISANIESALADISFSAIELPADVNVFDASFTKTTHQDRYQFLHYIC